MAHQFKVGDVIIARNGRKPATITSIYSSTIYAKYNHNGSSVTFNHYNIKPYEGDETMADTKTLYSLTKPDGTTVYGTHVGTNSQNKLLIEVKGTNEIILADKSQLEEVVPYTFKVRINGRDQHFQGEPGKFKKGDVLIYTGNGADRVEIAMVTAVDTKHKAAGSTFKGIKVLTEEL
jgi:hypothetical protein